MNCPYCGGPMEAGRLEAGHNYAVYWIPEDGMIGRLETPFRSTARAFRDEGACFLGKVSKLTWAAKTYPTAWFCKSCGYIIVKPE